MPREPLKRVVVDWTGPFTPAQIAEEEQRDNGLYQVYGRHPVFGPGSLLYVGETKKQGFAARLGQHQGWMNDGEHGKVEVYLGVVDSDDSELLDGDLDATIEAVEAFVIWWHSPPYNSKYISAHKGHPLWVQHRGSRGSLHAEQTTGWGKREKPNDLADT